MRLLLRAMLLGVTLCLPKTTTAQTDHVAGEVIVQLKQDADLDRFTYRAEDLGLRIKSILAQPLMGRGSYILLMTSDDMAVGAMLEALKQDEAVKQASPNYVRKSKRLPDDTGFPRQWGLRNTGQAYDYYGHQYVNTPGFDIDAENAWDITTGSDSVVIVVADSGVQYDHPDLADNMWENPNPGQDGAWDGTYGADFAADNDGNNDNNPMDTDGHGTHVAGIIGAEGNNGQGVAGVNWDVSILALKLERPDGYYVDSDVIEGLNYILVKKILRGINIVAANGSFGGPGKNPIVKEKLAELGPAGVIWVSAAGNSAFDNDSHPLKEFVASFDLPGIISVAAMNGTDELTSFSQWGARTADLGAPGEFINSTYITDTYKVLDGTSMAAPHVTGVIGLLAAAYPNDTAWTRIRRILSGVVELENLENKTLTKGRLNAILSLQEDMALRPFVVNASQVTGMSFGTEFSLEGFGFGAGRGRISFSNNQLSEKTAELADWSDSKASGYVPKNGGKYVQVYTDSSWSNALEMTAWTDRAESSTTHELCASAVWKDKLYLFGGKVGDSSGKATAEVYHPASNTWSTLASMPSGRMACAAAESGGKIYVIGGGDANLEGTVAEYDPSKDTWSSVTPSILLESPAAAAVGDDIYVLGGNDGDEDPQTEIYRFNPAAETKIKVADLVTARAYHAAAVVNDKVYVFGGMNRTLPLSSYEVFDPSDNSVAQHDMPVNASYCSAAAVGQDIHLSAGMWMWDRTSPSPEPLTFVLNTATGVWSNKSGTLEEPLWNRYRGAALYLDGRGLYLAGGSRVQGDAEVGLTSLNFLDMGPVVGAASSQPVSGQTVTITGNDVSYDSDSQLRATYQYPSAYGRFSDVVTFNATVSKAGELAAFQYAFTAPRSAAVSSLALHKLFDSNNTCRAMAYADSASDSGDGLWRLSNDTSAYINGTVTLIVNATYTVTTYIQDNGAFDQDRALGAIRDPQVIGTSANGGSSSSGCMMIPEAKFGLDALLPLLGLLALSVRRMASRMKRE
jgi:subtilisin family serine protease